MKKCMTNLAAAAVISFCCVPTGRAEGEFNLHLKSGYFQWVEKIDGKDFVKEKGAMTAFGVSRLDRMSRMSLQEVVEVWGGGLDYDGHDITNTTVLKSDTVYLGTREEITAALNLPVTASTTLGPVAGVGHKFWLRSRSGEDWNLIYGRFGASAGHRCGTYTINAAGGATVPFYTRSHVNLEASGYEDVVTHPKGKPSVYAELSARRGWWSIAMSYEETNFAESAKVTAKATTPVQRGVAVVDSKAFQPRSNSSLVSMKVTYHF